LQAQHGPALTLDVAVLAPDEWADAVCHTPLDLVITVGGAAQKQKALEIVKQTQTPALLITHPSATQLCQAICVFPGDDLTEIAADSSLHLGASSFSAWDWSTAAPLCAGLARAMLLRGTPYRRSDLEALWEGGKRVLTIGGVTDPLAVRWSTPAEAQDKARRHQQPSHFHMPTGRRGTVLIAGLGSLGSIAAICLAPHTRRMVIVDPDNVDVYNPVRQAYPRAAVGRPKAWALRDRLLRAGAEIPAHAPPTEVEALEVALTEEHQVTALITRYGITAALVVTGTLADFAIARALRVRDVPHVVGRCYPRARYWEAILVDGQRGPGLSDLRGHLQLGPTPPLTPEQIAAYSNAGALEAEPATLIESGWAAAWLARLTAQLSAPAGLRERWLLELLAAERTCLIGGVGVERTPDGPAYGITLPGEIRAWGQGEIRQ
jgi:hypothetical protein